MDGLLFFLPLLAAISFVYIALRYNTSSNEPRDARMRLVMAAMGVLLCAMTTAVAAIALQPANRKAPKAADTATAIPDAAAPAKPNATAAAMSNAAAMAMPKATAIAWIQWGHSELSAGLPKPAGLIARALVAAANACPDIRIDNQSPQRMVARKDARAAIFGTICEYRLARSSLKVKITGQQEGTLLSQEIAPEPARIAMFGDTGCRLTYYRDQGCNPDKWPFPAIAGAIAAQSTPNAKIDLVVHLGDYFYREAPCEKSTSPCMPGPYQDREETWRAEFFEPARELLAKAPWIFVRGNHEDCQRGGYGWSYYFGDGAYPCMISHDVAYLPFTNLAFLNFDTAHAGDDYNDASVHQALAGLEGVASKLLAGTPPLVFLLTHKPTYALCAATKALDGDKARPSECDPKFVKGVGGVRSVLDVVKKVAGRTIIVGGDIHVFQVADFEGVTQVILGNGGALRDDENYTGIADETTKVAVEFADERVSAGPEGKWKTPDSRGSKIGIAQVWREFGFGLVDLKQRPKIMLTMYDINGKSAFACDLTDAKIDRERCR
ncbi:MAG TPA: metallophosphoesterase [Reyranella sp.]|nr:metallophosphoesterase [Reyranella sp.]